MKKFVDWDGNQITTIPDGLLVPIDLQTLALEETLSELKDVNNTVNVIASTYKPKLFVSEYLTDVNNWFMLDTGKMKEHLHWYNRKPFKLMSDQSISTLIMIETGYFRCGFGFDDYRWIYGHAVS
jgi:hypothetical protein